ncbi:hypothetical protein [Micromonospora sp. DT41]|uniref:hypothetical protein n=1 Tax=Micromonospora sp. DT41 TaxID=3393437 RepID=UPI003CEB549B
MSRDRRGEQPVAARMPADVDAPDKLPYGLTFRQLPLRRQVLIVTRTTSGERGEHRIN